VKAIRQVETALTFGGDRDLDHGVNLQGQRGNPDPGSEEGDDKVVERQGEDISAPATTAGRMRGRVQAEGLPGAGAKVAGGFEDALVSPTRLTRTTMATKPIAIK